MPFFFIGQESVEIFNVDEMSAFVIEINIFTVNSYVIRISEIVR